MMILVKMQINGYCKQELVVVILGNTGYTYWYQVSPPDEKAMPPAVLASCSLGIKTPTRTYFTPFDSTTPLRVV